VLHRYLNHEHLSVAVIDDAISRGRWQDWADLRRTVLADRDMLTKVERVCRAHVADPYAQRHHFWLHHVEEHLAAA
jgi:hypothetical protein